MSKPCISITVQPEGERDLLIIEDVLGHRAEVRTESVSCIESFHNDFGPRLEEIMKILPGLYVSDPSSVSEALRELDKWGKVYYAFYFLSDDDDKESGEAHRIFNRYINISEPISDSSMPGAIEIKSALDHTIPLEFLILSGTSSFTKIRTKGDLKEVMKRFLGFRFIINRIILKSKGQSQNKILSNQPKIVIKYFRNSAIKPRSAINSELNFFINNCKHFELKGPWPQGKVNGFPEEFARNIFFPNYDFSGEEAKVHDQFHHFLCHCHVNGNVSNHYLEFCQGQIAELPEIVMLIGDRKANNPHEADMPVVFLNACGGASIIKPGMMSFPRLFLKLNRNRAFIGAEASVPTVFGPEFSKRFYVHILNGKSLGHAIYLAKWDMINLYNNPLGMLYTLYGSPDLKIPADKEAEKECINEMIIQRLRE